MSRRIYIDAEVDVWDVLSDCTAKELIEALKRKRQGAALAEGLGEATPWEKRITDCLEKGTPSEAFRLLQEMLIELSVDDKLRETQRAKYHKAMATRDPVTNQPVIQ